ncbi:zinc finger protein 98-like [Clarias gariepinus]|uniref:zinc finger protein 98-like n=1 Tax=Clarias gariepinus TaxID=13013 RepID=UPI00234D149B|nr:zinc finger protein 98-like [Clarias gariepinus]
MAPLLASDDSDDADKMTKQLSSPKMCPRNDLSQDAVSDGKKSTTQQKDSPIRTYSYMSPISSDVDEIPVEKPPRKKSTKQAKRQYMKCLHEEKPRGRIKRHIKKTQRNKDPSPVKSDSELENDVSEESGKKRDRVRIQVRTSLWGSDRNCVTGMGRSCKRQNNIHVSKDSDSETFSNELNKKAHTYRKSNQQYKAFKEKVERRDDSLSDLDNSRPTADQDQAVKAETTDLHVQHIKRSSPKKKEGQVPRKAIPIKCEICSRSIRCKAILKRHMLTHTGEKPFKCEECGKQYTSSSNLRIHQLSHSGKMDYVCNECGQKFTHLPYLKRHLLRHSGKKMHVCEHCGKGFFQKYHLLRHIPIHTRQTAHICDKCDMSFNRTDYLKLHLLNVHQIESNMPEVKLKKHKCEMCDKSFANPASLETHKRIHTGVMPFSCSTCSRQFKQSSHLYSHMITHSSEKPHSCNICQLKFSRKNYLRKHKERMHSAALSSEKGLNHVIDFK